MDESLIKIQNFTIEEKNLILQALNLLFQSGAVRGNISQVEETLSLARSIEQKFQVVELALADE